jgi:glycine betaine catabolism B
MATDALLRCAAPSAAWDPETDDTLVCVDVHDETHDVKTFTLTSPAGKSIRFVAGQHFRFEVPQDGGTESRCYSISSSPHRRGAIAVTVKRAVGGRVSNWLHDNLFPGMTIKAQGPQGVFARPVDAAKLLLLSAGSGITPLMSIARDAADRGGPADIVFLHAARTPRDLVFRRELAGIAERLKGFRLFLLPEDLSGERSWHGLSGRISTDLLRLAVPDLASRLVMCCGPAPFMAAARSINAELGHDPQNYLEESFDPPNEAEVAPAPATKAVPTFSVSFAKQVRSIEVASDQTVLACAKKAGIRLPSSCASGICGTCKSKLVSGRVEMSHNGGIRQREVDAGFFLPCCSKPLSDLVIDR